MKLKLKIVTIFILYLFMPYCEYYQRAFQTNNPAVIIFMIALNIIAFKQIADFVGWISNIFKRKPLK